MVRWIWVDLQLMKFLGFFLLWNRIYCSLSRFTDIFSLLQKVINRSRRGRVGARARICVVCGMAFILVSYAVGWLSWSRS